MFDHSRLFFSAARTTLLMLLLVGLLSPGLGAGTEEEGQVLVLTEDNFDKELAKGPLMVDVYATW